jgi:hypothetical protein
MKAAVPVKVHIPGLPDVTRLATGYAGDDVVIEANGHIYRVPKDRIKSEDHAKINEQLRKR